MKSLEKWNENSIKIEEAVRHLHLISVDARLYSDSHPKFKETLNLTLQIWNNLLLLLGTLGT